jgi:hypothetical protein
MQASSTIVRKVADQAVAVGVMATGSFTLPEIEAFPILLVPGY